MSRDRRVVDWYHAGGERRRAHGRSETLVDPATEAPWCEVAGCTADDVHDAVACAQAAAAPWAGTPVHERAAAVRALADTLHDRRHDLATDVMREIGMPAAQSLDCQVGWPVGLLHETAELAHDFAFESAVGASCVVREPIGVVACITPWNFPIHQIVEKCAPAILAGNTVVVKPSELSPVSALHLADAAAEAGIPGGVLNVVPGDGAVGRSLIDAPGVAAVAFTGSTAVGRAVAGRAAVSMQRLLLELGGKSPAVVLDDASLPEAVVETVRRCMFHSGQVCNALTKLVVPRHLQAEAVELALAEVAGMPLGNPDDPATVLGPLVSARQRERVLGILAHALTAGATVTRSDAHTVPARGWFVPPTIVSDVAPTDLVATEEIFGPVLCVVPYDGDDAAAVAVANHADFDLAAAVWAEDEDRALRVARSVRAGQVSINGAPFDGAAPFGGFRHSGVGRIHGTAGLLQFTEQKAIQHRRSPQS